MLAETPKQPDSPASPDSTTPAAAPPRAPWRDFVVPTVLLTALVVTAHLAASRWESWQTNLMALGPLAPMVYLLLWLIMAPCGFPAAALGLTAGFLFGTGPGSAWATLGLVVSGALMFALGRRWLRPRVTRLAATRPRLAQMERAAAGGGVRLHLLARLSPLNYALTSYTLAAGGAKLRVYLIGLAGCLPGLWAYVWLGAAARRGVRGDGDTGLARLVVPIVGGLSLLALSVIVARAARRAWRDDGEGSGRADRKP